MAIAIIMKDNYTSVLTCSQASIGRQHAVLVTRGGELFTWGSGHGGKLGLGHMMDAHSPQRVHTLWGQSIKHVAAGGRTLGRPLSALSRHVAIFFITW